MDADFDRAARRRPMRWLAGWFLAGVAVIAARIVWIEVRHGDVYRAVAMAPLTQTQRIPAPRGRILSRDGVVLAADEPVAALAVHYRWIESPPDPRWLRLRALSKLPRTQRRDLAAIDESEHSVLEERRALWQRLAVLTGDAESNLDRRRATIQARVSQQADAVNAARAARQAAVLREADDSDDSPGGGWLGRVRSRVARWFPTPAVEASSAPITIAEQVDYHVACEELSHAAVVEIEAHPERYPGVRIEPRFRRTYPRGSLAAHVVGYVGRAREERVERSSPGATLSSPLDSGSGLIGIERAYDAALRGEAGRLTRETTRGGDELRSTWEQQPAPGRDVVLTLDWRLQAAAERLLDDYQARRLPRTSQGAINAAGGAIVALDVQNGAVLALASGPRFDPNLFTLAAPEAIALLTDEQRPLFHRAISMTLPPGSIVKPISAAAALAMGTISPEETCVCQGYLQSPDRHRCALYRRLGVGHGAVDLEMALAQSCNVYFFTLADQLPGDVLSSWLARFGFGRRTESELTEEAAGQVTAWQTSEAPSADARRALAIGQGDLLVSPLQAARYMAALANGGRLVQPHLLRDLGTSHADAREPAHLAASQTVATSLENLDAPDDADDESTQALPQPVDESSTDDVVPGLTSDIVEQLQHALAAVVQHPQGTAHESVSSPIVPIAGKTGTAEVGGGLADHAWFVGYAPADEPRVALAVVLEQAGDGGVEAGPLARKMFEQMASDGLLGKAFRAVQPASFSPSR